MNTCFCDNCGSEVEYETNHFWMINGVELADIPCVQPDDIPYIQYEAHCKICGLKVHPLELIKENYDERRRAEKKRAKNGRSEILKAAEKIVSGERQEQYGSPEDNFATIARYWECYLDARAKNGGTDATFTLGADDVAAMMILFKAGRLSTGVGSADTWIDIAGYAACGGQIQTERSGGESKDET